MKKLLMLAAGFGLISLDTAHAATHAQVVLELFTSQGCSSCPPADALIKRLYAENNQLLPLSFHVDYWDYLGWKDPYSSPANTERQHGYARALDGKIYTPELVVNGSVGVVGSDERQVRSAIQSAQQQNQSAQANIVLQPDGRTISVEGTGGVSEADVWEINFRPYVSTDVARGENGGRQLDHVNSVTGLRHLGTWAGKSATFTLDLPAESGDKTAVLIQLPHDGRIVSAAVIP